MRTVQGIGKWTRLLALALLLPPIFAAQAPAVASEGERTRPRDVSQPFGFRYPLPFKYGERLTYEVKFSRFPVAANVGELTFTVNPVNGSDQHVKFEVQAVSRGALTSLFGVKVRDTFTTLAGKDDMFVYTTTKNIDEGDYRRHQIAVFDRPARKVKFTDTDVTAPSAPPRVVEQETRPWVQDTLSALYFTRTRKLEKVGKEVKFPVSDEGQTYDIGVVLLGSDQVKVDAGSFKTLKLDAKIFDGRLIRREGTLYVWVTDDARRIPVKAVMKIPAGTVTFELTSLVEGSSQITGSTPEADVSDE
jgi:hypothetical protein